MRVLTPLICGTKLFPDKVLAMDAAGQCTTSTTMVRQHQQHHREHPGPSGVKDLCWCVMVIKHCVADPSLLAHHNVQGKPLLT